MTDILSESVILAIILLMVAGIVLATRRRPRRVSAVVVIQEGRLPGEPAEGIACPHCGRRFKQTQMFEYEVVKCPYCGSEVS